MSRWSELQIEQREWRPTPYGNPSSQLTFGRCSDQPVLFLARHGDGHSIPPHRINYRANLWALKESGIKQVVAVAAVGGIHSKLVPGSIVVPDQIIDYTDNREHTFYDGNSDDVTHIDFSWPYSETVRQGLIKAARQSGLSPVTEGTYGCTQGPRLETAAEIRRMERDGCDIVGMTGMPEAALARELGLEYACCAIVVNPAAGKTDREISMDEIMEQMASGIDNIVQLLNRFIPAAAG